MSREVRAGPYRVDLDERRLIGHGGDVHLAPREWSLLEVLLDRPGEVVTKQAIGEALWPDQPMSEYALSRTVRRLREALGDDARRPRYVKTEHGIGFRWIAESADGRSGAGPLFVGRTEELRRLSDATLRAEAGDPSVVLVEGELGVGKTRLIERFVDTLDERWLVGRGRCPETTMPPEPYGPLLDLIDAVVRTGGSELLQALRRYAPTWLAQMPWLADPSELDMLVEAQRLATRTRMVRELVNFVGEVSATSLLLLFVDDLQWADAATLDALGMLAADDRPTHLLLAMTRRRGDVGPRQSEPRQPVVFATHGTADRITLAPLPVADVAELVRHRLPAVDADVHDEQVSRLVEWTAGNPLFALAMLDHLRDSSDATAAARTDLPRSLSDLLDFLIGRLPPDERAIVDVLALLNRPSTPRQIASVLDGDEEDVEARLGLLGEHSSLVVVESDGERYDLSHAAYRVRVVAQLRPVHAGRLHLAIAHAMNADPDGADAGAIGEHFALGGDRAAAVPHWIAAARVALARFAHAEALELFELALGASGEGELDPAMEVEVRLGLALCQLHLRSRQDTRTQENIDRLQELVAPLSDRADAFNVWRDTLLVNNLAGRTDRVRAMAPALLAMAEERGRPHELMDAHHSMGEAALHADRLDASLGSFDRADAIFSRLYVTDDGSNAGRTRRLRDTGSRIKSARAGVLFLLGRLDAVHDEIAASHALCSDGVNAPLVRVGNATICASIAFLMGDHAEAARFAELAFSVADDENDDFLAIVTVIQAAVGGRSSVDEIRRAATDLLERPAIPFPLGPRVFARARLLPDDEMIAFIKSSQRVCATVETHWCDDVFAAALADLEMGDPSP